MSQGWFPSIVIPAFANSSRKNASGDIGSPSFRLIESRIHGHGWHSLRPTPADRDPLRYFALALRSLRGYSKLIGGILRISKAHYAGDCRSPGYETHKDHRGGAAVAAPPCLRLTIDPAASWLRPRPCRWNQPGSDRGLSCNEHGPTVRDYRRISSAARPPFVQDEPLVSVLARVVRRARRPAWATVVGRAPP